jgi:DNA-binding transcriptional LysR family regulator
MDRFGDLDVFAHVVTAKGMSAAGRELNLSPAVISKRIRRLEERLGVRLLQRTTRQLALTEAGQGFYERVVSILSSMSSEKASILRSGSPTCRIRASSPSAWPRTTACSAPRRTTFQLMACRRRSAISPATP